MGSREHREHGESRKHGEHGAQGTQEGRGNTGRTWAPLREHNSIYTGTERARSKEGLLALLY